MRRVMVGLDGSLTSRAAFHEAVLEAEMRDAVVHAVHVAAIPVNLTPEFVQVDLDLIPEAGERFLEAELGIVKEEFGGVFPVEVTAEVLTGHPAVQLLAAAEASSDRPAAELVVLGSRGLGGFKGLLLGSVTSYTVHHLPTRLLIVPRVASDLNAENGADQ